MAVGHVHAADWLLDRRNLQALPRLAPVYDLAHKSCHGCALQHVARPADLRCQGPRWYHPRALLLLRFCRLHLLQSVLFSVLGPAALIVIILDFFPTYLFTALSSFSWICWMAPHNPTVNQLFGVNHGLAMGVLTFDWGQIAYNGSPLPIPWWAMANVAVTVVFFFWFLLPVLYVRTPYFSFLFALLIIGDCSTPTFGIVLIFPWCLRTLSITRGANTTSPGSSTAIPPSTSRLTRNTAPSSFPGHLPLPTGSRLHLSPPLLHTPSSTTANRSGLRLVAPSPNNLTSTPASCPCTGRFRIRGT